MKRARPLALTIGGSDPSGGAGIQADIKTFQQFGVYGQSVVTLIAVQNSHGVSDVEYLRGELVEKQLWAVLSDMPPQAAKTGALGEAATVEAVAAMWKRTSIPLIIDPVMLSSSGAVLMDADAQNIFREQLLPQAFLVTPNTLEARTLTGASDMKGAAKTLHEIGAKNVLITGGHLENAATDLLFTEGQFHEFPAKKLSTSRTHGSGCVFSAAITAQLASGVPLVDAVKRAKHFVHNAILTAEPIGAADYGPLNLFGKV